MNDAHEERGAKGLKGIADQGLAKYGEAQKCYREGYLNERQCHLQESQKSLEGSHAALRRVYRKKLLISRKELRPCGKLPVLRSRKRWLDSTEEPPRDAKTAHPEMRPPELYLRSECAHDPCDARAAPCVHGLSHGRRDVDA